MYLCRYCGTLWTRHRNNRLARSQRRWDEKNEKWYWAMMVRHVICPDCKRRDEG